MQYPFESLFRSLQYALLDNSCREYLFICDFFMVSASTALDFFNSIFGKTIAMFMVCVRSSPSCLLVSPMVCICTHLLIDYCFHVKQLRLPCVPGLNQTRFHWVFDMSPHVWDVWWYLEPNATADMKCSPFSATSCHADHASVPCY